MLSLFFSENRSLTSKQNMDKMMDEDPPQLSKELAELVELKRLVKVKEHAKKKFHGFLMLALLSAFVGSMISTVHNTYLWITRYRGGLKGLINTLDSASEEELQAAIMNPTPPKVKLNSHAFYMVLSLSLFAPMSVVMKILLCRCPFKFRAIVIQSFRFLAQGFFLMGVIEIFKIDVKDLPYRRPDRATHLVLSVPISVLMIAYTIIPIFRVLRLCYEDFTHNPIISWIINTIANDLLWDYTERLLSMTSFIAIGTGFLSYLLIIFTAEETDLQHVFDDKVKLDENDMPEERFTFNAILFSAALVFFLHALVSFYEHEILFHTDIITFEMYHNNFLKIAESLEGQNDDRRKCPRKIASKWWKRMMSKTRAKYQMAVQTKKKLKRLLKKKNIVDQMECVHSGKSVFSLNYDDVHELSSSCLTSGQGQSTKRETSSISVAMESVQTYKTNLVKEDTPTLCKTRHMLKPNRGQITAEGASENVILLIESELESDYPSTEMSGFLSRSSVPVLPIEGNGQSIDSNTSTASLVSIENSLKTAIDESLSDTNKDAADATVINKNGQFDI